MCTVQEDGEHQRSNHQSQLDSSATMSALAPQPVTSNDCK